MAEKLHLNTSLRELFNHGVKLLAEQAANPQRPPRLPRTRGPEFEQN
jgi:hypothetical protein